ncbi:HAMP domain-containing histidine kinase [Nonomuraea sp. K274]|uniref:histidine kinase n=1 Tax=Nonomuraea cypriaca TaxID=1187855 RepID=A0A931AJX0_9ACTN|nr:HAMP domain-containing sensor histidine kinase [Nonomuraea cypriaca]MBF8190412.1 HAMP domain-containing histidine kinase [Nonomuraea cypriaca]
MTIATVVVFGVILLVGVVAISLAYPVWARNALTDQADSASRHLATVIDYYRFRGPIPPLRGVQVMQVVDTRGRVVASTRALGGQPPLTSKVPTGGDSRVSDEVCRSDGCLLVVGTSNRVTVYGPVVAYAAVREPFLLNSPFLPALLLASSGLLLTLMGWGAWYGVGRVLAPVERIRSGLEHFGAADLSRRIEVPDTEDEVAELAATVNDTLSRLEMAVERHRRFVSDASHELRTPITALMVRLEAGADDLDPADWRAALEEARRLSDIVQDLLLMARLDARAVVERERIDLGGLVEEEVARRSGRLPVTTKTEPGVVVEGSRLQLARLLTNLLSNADRYGDSAVLVSVWGEGDQAVSEVVDDGPGIPPEMRERVFERFTRLDRTRSRDAGGSGLGLPIARDIARAHGGTLHIGEGPGARLILRLPRL